MKPNIGKKIREFRKANNLSQEALAKCLGVSFQAVSKWENELTMPDISLLPGIASFFGISIDELFDYDHMESERLIRKICVEAKEYRVSDPKRAEDILREGLKQFPGNEHLLNNLLYTIHDINRSAEKIDICESLIASTHDDAVKYDSLRILAQTYYDIGKKEMVGQTLNRIPELYFSKLEYMAVLLDDETALNAAVKCMQISLTQLIDMLQIMHNRLMNDPDRTESADYRKVAQQILEISFSELKKCAYMEQFVHWIKERLEEING